jgi:aspartyl-tRNA(Asn)/glutamyl-tRNA(Gln) amidotransferase subunit A
MLTIAEAGRRFRDGSLTPLALTEEILGRIDRENPKLNAYWKVYEAGALAAASEATRELAAGKDRGPLHGIPIAVKDLFDVEGDVTTAGAHPAFHPPPAKEDAEVMARLRKAGAVFLGKTALHEWALGVTTNNPHFGPTRNPHDLDRVPGGSSGGSAAAVAAELCLGALGTDTGGSIRIPAAFCGIVGLKPTYGRVPMKGVFPLSTSLDHAGPLANTVEDCFLMLEAMTEFTRSDAPRPRILVPDAYFFEDLAPGLGDLVRSATARLGASSSISLGPRLLEAWNANVTILLAEAAALHRDRLAAHPKRFGDDLRVRLQRGLAYSEVELSNAAWVRKEWSDVLANDLPARAVLAVPTAPVPAVPIDTPWTPELSRTCTRFTQPFNLAGAPALSVPCGKVDGLPVGLQLVAAPGQENLLWAAARGLF